MRPSRPNFNAELREGVSRIRAVADGLSRHLGLATEQPGDAQLVADINHAAETLERALQYRELARRAHARRKA